MYVLLQELELGNLHILARRLGTCFPICLVHHLAIRLVHHLAIRLVHHLAIRLVHHLAIRTILLV
jgi:hypothetical protein